MDQDFAILDFNILDLIHPLVINRDYFCIFVYLNLEASVL